MTTPLRTITVNVLARAHRSARTRSGSSTGSPQSTAGLPSGPGWGWSMTTTTSGVPGPATLAVEQGEHGLGARVVLFLDQVRRTIIGLAVVEHCLQLLIDPGLEAQHRFRV